MCVFVAISFILLDVPAVYWSLHANSKGEALQDIDSDSWELIEINRMFQDVGIEDVYRLYSAQDEF